AITVYQRNLGASLPLDQQRYAILKTTELLLREKKTAEAAQMLEQYLEQHPASGAADRALLALGELQLNLYVSGAIGTNNTAASTNLLRQALDHFDALLSEFPESPLVGKAMLDQGWCLWVDGKFAESKAAFELAAARLPYSEDQAVARFKWADAQFKLKDFAG